MFFRKSVSPDTNQPGVAGAPLLQLCDVVKVYQIADGGFKALKGITADFYPGEFVGVIGKSGAGKTTLLNMITGVDHLTSGGVHVRGVSVHGMGQSKLAAWRGLNMGIVYQSFRLMPTLSLLDNIMLPIDFCGNYHAQESLERALQLLRDVELEDHALKPPTAISGGQQQRVAIARALANDPPILVTDEPTGRLDSVTAEIIIKMFEKLAQQGKLVLMATHDTSFMHRFTRCVRIADGELVEDSGRSQS